MKQIIQVILVGLLLIGCASPGSTPPATPEKPKAPTMIIDVATATQANTATAIATATDAPTFTPIPATFTLTPTREARSIATPGRIVGVGTEVIAIVGSLPVQIAAGHDKSVNVYLVLADEQLLPLDQYKPSVAGITAVKVVGTGAWTLEFIGPTTPTQRPPTLKAGWRDGFRSKNVTQSLCAGIQDAGALLIWGKSIYQ